MSWKKKRKTSCTSVAFDTEAKEIMKRKTLSKEEVPAQVSSERLNKICNL
jgi:hypothetical protein